MVLDVYVVGAGKGLRSYGESVLEAMSGLENVRLNILQSNSKLIAGKGWGVPIQDPEWRAATKSLSYSGGPGVSALHGQSID